MVSIHASALQSQVGKKGQRTLKQGVCASKILVSELFSRVSMALAVLVG